MDFTPARSSGRIDKWGSEGMDLNVAKLVRCPTCGAGPGSECRTHAAQRRCAPHAARRAMVHHLIAPFATLPAPPTEAGHSRAP
jgi:hypothetical protein